MGNPPVRSAQTASLFTGKCRLVPHAWRRLRTPTPLPLLLALRRLLSTTTCMPLMEGGIARLRDPARKVSARKCLPWPVTRELRVEFFRFCRATPLRNSRPHLEIRKVAGPIEIIASVPMTCNSSLSSLGSFADYNAFRSVAISSGVMNASLVDLKPRRRYNAIFRLDRPAAGARQRPCSAQLWSQLRRPLLSDLRAGSWVAWTPQAIR